MMLQPDAVWLAVAPVDMRLGIDGLSLKVQQALGRAPCDGTAYVFSNRRRNRIKLICWDGNGVWLCQRRLHRGHFIWPQPGDEVCELADEQWQWLISGVDWQRLLAPTVEIALSENKHHDAADFSFSPAIWDSAIKESSYVAAQEELRLGLPDKDLASRKGR